MARERVLAEHDEEKLPPLGVFRCLEIKSDRDVGLDAGDFNCLRRKRGSGLVDALGVIASAVEAMADAMAVDAVVSAVVGSSG